MAALTQIVTWLDGELRSADVPDYDAAFNGLQLANGGTVARVAAAVDFSSEVVDAAVSAGAELLVVHHGMFWGGARPIVGVAYERLARAIAGRLAVYSSHIPLDAHPRFGNNVLLARELGLESDAPFGEYRGTHVGVAGSANLPTAEIVSRVRAFSAEWDTTAVATRFDHGRVTRRWAIVTGAGASTATLAEAAALGIDTLIVGEGPHHTAVDAVERGMVVIYGGHYATETLGVRALAERVGERFGIPWTFLRATTGL